MIRSARFWISLTAFQIIFGLTIFSLTRQYYISAPIKAHASSAVTSQPFPAWPNRSSETNLPQTVTSTSSVSTSQDPIEISQQANKLFANKQYAQAAELYARLLTFNPNNVDVLNNLGITLHYLDRSAEALVKLNKGVAIDPTQQRIWLTLGFVNSQIGDIEQARTALATAVQMDANNEIGKSASSMLENLP